MFSIQVCGDILRDALDPRLDDAAAVSAANGSQVPSRRHEHGQPHLDLGGTIL